MRLTNTFKYLPGERFKWMIHATVNKQAAVAWTPYGLELLVEAEIISEESKKGLLEQGDFPYICATTVCGFGSDFCDGVRHFDWWDNREVSNIETNREELEQVCKLLNVRTFEYACKKCWEEHGVRVLEKDFDGEVNTTCRKCGGQALTEAPIDSIALRRNLNASMSLLKDRRIKIAKEIK